MKFFSRFKYSSIIEIFKPGSDAKRYIFSMFLLMEFWSLLWFFNFSYRNAKNRTWNNRMHETFNPIRWYSDRWKMFFEYDEAEWVEMCGKVRENSNELLCLFSTNFFYHEKSWFAGFFEISEQGRGGKSC